MGEIQNDNPVGLVKGFLACVGVKDVEQMRRVIHPMATACLIRGKEPRFQTLAQAVDTLAKAEQKFAEETWDEQEHLDGDYATVWTKFRITRDGELHQRGSSSFSCWRDPTVGWIILTMSDIARTPDETSEAP